jgi:hypothetical protein
LLRIKKKAAFGPLFLFLNDEKDLEPVMRPVAEGPVAGVFAAAEPGLLGFFGGEDVRLERGAFVRAVAERLLLRLAAGAEPVFFAGDKIDFDRFSGGDGWFGHLKIS